jgi:hypothetical protein
MNKIQKKIQYLRNLEAVKERMKRKNLVLNYATPIVVDSVGICPMTKGRECSQEEDKCLYLVANPRSNGHGTCIRPFFMKWISKEEDK